ncbi:hypothetical protein DES53_102376 [Roseimicrobium gellanilyticum]|uniref:Uncharacterized protein n=2 Tax=Roseimicrobium gellanilyticum TaxID=748857 RepID=A0A366HQP4_9BACT|nr:hypothetical protein DES53_102376 [Roseimicrobium gellanilyticum]
MGHPFDGDGTGPPRAGSSNVQAYLYMEPYTCRVECLVWMPAVLGMLNLPPGTEMVLPDAVKQQVLEKARVEAAPWCALRIDGLEVKPERQGLEILKGMPGNSDQIKPDEAVAVMDTMLGMSWEFHAPANVGQVELEWRGFRGEVQVIPVTVIYGPTMEAGIFLTPKAPSSVWKNEGRIPPAPPLAQVPMVDAVWVNLPVALLISGVVVLIALVWIWRSPGKGMARVLKPSAFAAIVCVGAWTFAPHKWSARLSPGKTPTQEEAGKILDALLRNTYRAFDQSSESAIYDVLARSVHGPLLEKLYLQTVRALTLEGMDGTRVKVTDMAVNIDRVLPQQDGFIAEGQWTAVGTVGHWGHMHQRINRYTARLTLEPIGNAWKITGLEVLEERRM